VAGASGFTGALAASLVWRHPGLELAGATSRGDAGTALADLYPRHRVPVVLEELDPDRAGEWDAAVVAYPHGAAAALVAELRSAGLPVVDLSADFRLSAESYERTYGEHGAPGILGDAVYGLPEVNREEVAGAALVANPGCYPTAALLALAPLAAEGLVADVVIDAKSGVSGAGRGSGERHHFVNVTENFAPYGTEGHRHGPEISEQLALIAGDGEAPRMTFVPHLLPLDQGLLASCYVTLRRPLAAAELQALYEDRYADEPFVDLASAPPGVRDVRETNLCRVHVTLDETGGRALAFAAIDNLWKGAAGQAVQNLNLMLGLPETEGLL
jgi:N-acetyl-gamma-glutamyl-phosphate reductase